VQVLTVGRHLRKLRRGAHRANRFTLVLRDASGDPAALEQRLRTIGEAGVPNYFGEQRFGRHGSTLAQGRRWMKGRRRITRDKRSLYLSALRAHVFNTLLAQRVENGTWNTVLPGDVCMLQGTRSFFTCQEVTDDIGERVGRGDLHPGLPLWGIARAAPGSAPRQTDSPAGCEEICDFLQASGLELAWRPARVVPDDFCWQFCDDGVLQLDFSLGAGSYATALLAEFVRYKEGCVDSGISCEQN